MGETAELFVFGQKNWASSECMSTQVCEARGDISGAGLGGKAPFPLLATPLLNSGHRGSATGRGHASINVRLLPPSELCSSRVSTESQPEACLSNQRLGEGGIGSNQTSNVHPWRPFHSSQNQSVTFFSSEKAVTASGCTLGGRENMFSGTFGAG